LTLASQGPKRCQLPKRGSYFHYCIKAEPTHWSVTIPNLLVADGGTKIYRRRCWVKVTRRMTGNKRGGPKNFVPILPADGPATRGSNTAKNVALKNNTAGPNDRVDENDLLVNDNRWCGPGKSIYGNCSFVPVAVAFWLELAQHDTNVSRCPQPYPSGSRYKFTWSIGQKGTTRTTCPTTMAAGPWFVRHIVFRSADTRNLDRSNNVCLGHWASTDASSVLLGSKIKMCRCH
jgi:hypothetical protein